MAGKRQRLLASGYGLLASCNGMGRQGAGGWLPMDKRADGSYFGTDGRQLAAPAEFREMTPAAIEAELRASGTVPLGLVQR